MGAFIVSAAGLSVSPGGCSMGYINVAQRAVRLIAGIAVLVPGLTVAAVSAAVIRASLIIERMTGAVPVEQRA